MSDTSLAILFIADIVGQPGLDIVTALLPSIIKKQRIDLCIANGENLDKGHGLSEAQVRQCFAAGIDVITGGNHTWSQYSFRSYLDTSKRVLRPLNYPDAPGTGSTIFRVRDGLPVGIINLQGRTFMYPIDCPFTKGREEIIRLREQTKVIIVDFHAEATAEKMAFAWYVDGMVSAVIGTHTHVQTADERILPKGTAYITDAGMTGPYDSVIGMDVQVSIKRFLTLLPEKHRVATLNIRLCGVVVEVDFSTGVAKKITRLNLP